jgi:hypothetical protein
VARNYLRGLLVFFPFFLLGALDAQPKAGVIIGVMLIHINGERAEQVAASLTSPTPAELLSALLADKGTEVVSRPQLAAADGMNMRLKIGPEIAVDLTPQIKSLEELRLRVGITASVLNPFSAGTTTLNIRDGELNLLCGLKGIPGLIYLPFLDKPQFGDKGVMIALIPQILSPLALAR